MIIRVNYVFFLLTGLVSRSFQSECVVSEWGTWSQCYGGCMRGLIVRNRDVVQPPLPELNSDNKMMQRLCPHLYETKYCDRTLCPYENVGYRTTTEKAVKQNFTESASNLVEKQMRKMGFTNENNSMRSELKNKFISETEQLFKLDDVLSRKLAPTIANVPSSSQAPAIDISSRQMSPKQWKQEMMGVANRNVNQLNSASFQGLPTPASLEQMNLNTNVQAVTPFANRNLTMSSDSNLENEHQAKNSKSKQSSDYSINNLLQRIEHALDSNQPLDERYIKRALRRNRKMSKLIVDAYRQRQTSAAVATAANTGVTVPTTAVPRSTTTVATTTTTTTTTEKPLTTATFETPQRPFESYTEELGTSTTTPMLYWPKHGYVPNTRKHASEITSQLYMTNEITQTLSEDPVITEIDPKCPLSKRCCKITRSDCSDGTEPESVKRWYRPPGSAECIAYHYPRCSGAQEMEDLPILFEQNCQDLCFAKYEKHISPLFYLESEDSK